MNPYVREIEKTRSYIQDFGGYNHNTRIGEGELYDCYNLSSDEYPVLTTKEENTPLFYELPRENGLMSQILGLLSGDELIVLYEYKNSVYLKCKDIPGDEDAGLLICEYNPSYKYKLVRMGANIIVFPFAVAFNTVSKSIKNFVFGNSYEGAKIELVAGESSGKYENYGYVYPSKDHLPQNAYLGTFYYLNNPEENVYDPNYDVYKITYENGKIMSDTSSFVGQCIRIKLPSSEIKGELSTITDISINNFGDSIVTDTQNLKLLHYQYSDDGEYVYLYVDGKMNKTLRVAEKGETVNLKINFISLDFIVECQNRLWGCIYNDGINEIRYSRLGDFSDWEIPHSAEDATLADAPGAISLGSVGAFTGVTAIDDMPVFFKEDIIHKVYVSPTGAHRIYNVTADGVAAGSGGSIARVNEYFYYMSPRGVIAFNGSSTRLVSEAFGNELYKNALGSALGDKYIVYCERDNEKYIFSYDTKRGIWHKELCDRKIKYITNHKNNVLMANHLPGIVSYNYGHGTVKYSFEFGEWGFESPDYKYLCRLDMRLKLDFGASFNVWIQYDSDGKWYNVERIVGTLATPKIETVNILPQRCEHFKLKVTGSGKMRLYGISKIYEKSEA